VNADIMEGKWKQMRGQMREWWGKLTDDDFDVIAGKKDKLVGTLQRRPRLGPHHPADPLPDRTQLTRSSRSETALEESSRAVALRPISRSRSALGLLRLVGFRILAAFLWTTPPTVLGTCRAGLTG
jgi:uncharacterized protein YjbJ (UPF0337 family)